MPSWDLMLAFLAATLVFAYMPGPATIYASAQTLARGRRAGFMSVLGLRLGGYLHVLAAALGLAALFRHVPEAYLAVKLAGALYLIWLGIGILRRRLDTEAVPHLPSKSARRAFIESVTVEVLNPKTALFFIAFLPQFVDPAAAFPVAAQLLILGVIVNILCSSADIACVLFASLLIARLCRSGAAGRLLRMAGGSLLVGLGLRLALVRD